MKAAEQQYWREREFVLDLLDNLPYSIFWKSRDSVFLGCNHLFAQTAGLDDPQDIVGKTDYDLPWSDGESEAYREDDQYVMDNRISKLDIEESQTLSDGSKIVLLTSKVPLLDKYDNVIGVLCIYTDITERKRMEDELRIAKEQAEASSIAKTEFLSNMSHDIRTPLSGIIGMAEMLAQKLEDPVFQEAADSILISGCHLMSFFDNCLELSRLESADITLLKEYFSLRETVDSVKGLFQAAINGKGLTLNIHISEDVPNIVVSSRVSIYRTLQNLVGNAIKFTDVGSITINVGVEESWTEHDTVVRLSVEDTGIGIASDKQEVIFEKMSRLTPSYEATYEGSGMGLYIVKRFISAMGGQVSLESTLGKGSTFTILFPVSVPVPQDNEMFASHLPNQLKGVGKAFESLPEVSIAPRPLRILLVEDNKTAQRTSKMVLASLDYSVDVADSGKVALEHFEPGKYGLIFMDIGLPDMSGNEISQIIREREASTSDRVPILAVSAHAASDIRQRCSSAGMTGMIGKPIMIKSAKECVAKYIYQQRGARVSGLIEF